MKKNKALELFLLSAISLYFELLIIRWMSGDIRAFTVFRTLPLISCFVGLGVGFAIGKAKNYGYLPLASLLFALALKLADCLGFSTWGFPSLNVFQWNNLNELFQINTAYLTAFILIIILLLSLPFGICVCIGTRLAILFADFKPLYAYSINIGGAIAGSLLFTLLSTFSLAPWQLLLLPLALIIIDLVFREKKLRLIYALPFILIPLIYIMVPSHPGKPLIANLLNYQVGRSKTLWSPYQRIDLSVFADTTEKQAEQQFLGLELSVNHLFYQYFFNPSPQSILFKSPLMEAIRDDYRLPFTFSTNKNVLIVGAGTGQNVSAAEGAGAQQIDAVEIDPIIIDIGRKYNSDYALSNVNLVCDDARHFMSQTKNRYDVINFSTLDSHTVSGLGSSVRVDAYIYTRESIAKALSLLKNNGVIEISFVTIAPWMTERLFRTLQSAAGYAPIVLKGKMIGTIYLLGPTVKNHTIKLPTQYEKLNITSSDRARELTDDWPYLYVEPNIIDWPYLIVLAAVILISTYAARAFLFAKNNLACWHMFFLGAAFLLLELHAIAFLSLLYGSTWITSAIVINSILIVILMANTAVSQFSEKIATKVPLVYACLFVSIAINYFLPTDLLLAAAQNNQFAIYSFMTIITVLPMGIAAIIFAIAFANTKSISQTMAFNLFGAVIGGLLEYLSNYWGIRALDLVAAGLYLASALCYFPRRP